MGGWVRHPGTHIHRNAPCSNNKLSTHSTPFMHLNDKHRDGEVGFSGSRGGSRSCDCTSVAGDSSFAVNAQFCLGSDGGRVNLYV